MEKILKTIKVGNYELVADEDGNYHHGGYLDLEGTAITALPDNLTVGGYLDLRGTAITALPDNLTVGGSLDLRGTAITALPDNLTVGGYLYLEGTAIIALPDNLTVGGYLYLEGTAIEGIDTSAFSNRNIPMFSWLGGRYILADGVFTEVISKRGKVYKVKKIGAEKRFYLVTDGNGKFAHGDTIKQAKEDLIYKIAGDADIEDYRGIGLEKILKFEDCIKLYRVVTGACSFGVKDFVSTNSIEAKSYTVKEIMEKTKGHYGHDRLVQFLNKQAV